MNEPGTEGVDHSRAVDGRAVGRKRFLGIAGVVGTAAVAGAVGSSFGGQQKAVAENPTQARLVQPGANGTDDGAAIQAAIRSLPSAGGLITLAPGSFTIRTPVVLPSGVALRGASAVSTILLAGDDILDAAVTARSANVVSDLTIAAFGPGSPTYSHIVVEGNECVIERCAFVGYRIGVVVGSATHPVVGTIVTECVFRSPSTADGAGAIDVRGFANAIVAKTIVTAPKGRAVQPSFGIRVGRGDTMLISDTNVTSHGIALDVAPPAGRECSALQVANSLFDSAGADSAGVSPSARVVPEGRVYNTVFANCWFGLASGSGIELGAVHDGVVAGLALTGCQFVGNQGDGLLVGSDQVTGWSVSGGTASGNGGAAIRVAAGSSGFAITGLVATGRSDGHAAAAGRGPNSRGIVISETADEFVVSGCLLTGNRGPGLQVTPGPARALSGNLA